MKLTIKEAAQQTGISAYTLRFYEKEGLLPMIERDDHGNRVYDEESLEWLDFVTSLRSTGMPLAQIRQYVDWYQEGDLSITQRKQLMLDHKAKVERDLQQTLSYLEKINYKIAMYEFQENQFKKLP
ncbi:MerR family transcriptional regulator [Paenibacillus sp. WLX1005]|uniref:MerR family transcriptional regulator n=1 Tax=unclassified Paenibacillus TaxID=185978 RepID=UPI003984184E